MPKNAEKFINLSREGYSAQGERSGAAELVLYGSVVKKRPVDWWTGETAKGNYIVEDEFLDDLKALEGCKDVTMRINSLGGDVHAALLIYNRLRDMATSGTRLTCIVDGAAMSAGSYIMCAADTVRASESSLIMIHRAAAMVRGYLNSEELRQLSEQCDVHDQAIAAAYSRKTGKSTDEILAMMSAETFMTGKDALWCGFAADFDCLLGLKNKLCKCIIL